MYLSLLMNKPLASQINLSRKSNMYKHNKRIVARLLFTLGAMLAVAYMPEGHAHGSYGDKVDVACSGNDPNNPTYDGMPASPDTPYGDKGDAKCSLCHMDGKGTKGIPVEPEWSAYHIIGPLAFCDQAPDGVISAPANNLTVNLGSPVSFSGSASNTAPDPVADLPFSYTWDFGGAADKSTDQNPTVALSKAGPVTVTFTVFDNKGRADASPAKITVNVVDPNANQPPDGSINSPKKDKSIKAGDEVRFSASATDPENDEPFMYKWDFGDGTAATDFMLEPKLTHTYASAGIYTVTLTVKDKQGLVDQTPATRVLTVKSKTACSDHDKDNFSPDGGVCGPIDCNDYDASINPGALEACGDKVDNDCNGQIDSNDAQCSGASCIGDLLKQVEIVKAHWDNDDRELTVKGTWATAGALVTLSDAKTGEILGTTEVKAHERHHKHEETALFWKFELEHPAVVPCRIRAEIDGRHGERDVAYAPADCSGQPAATNNPPVANDDNASTAKKEAVTIPVLANDTDEDKDALTIVMFRQAQHGVVTRDGEALTYTPKGGFTGNDSFTYTVSDHHGGTDKATVNVSVVKN